MSRTRMFWPSSWNSYQLPNFTSKKWCQITATWKLLHINVLKIVWFNVHVQVYYYHGNARIRCHSLNIIIWVTVLVIGFRLLCIFQASELSYNPEVRRGGRRAEHLDLPDGLDLSHSVDSNWSVRLSPISVSW